MADLRALLKGGTAAIGSGMLAKGFIPDMAPQVETPRFMMRIEGITSSTVEKFEEAMAIVSFTWKISRDVSPHASGHLFSSGTIRGHNTEVIALKSVQVMNMINSLGKGEKIDQIVIDELATIGENSVSIGTYTYDICTFTSAEIMIDSNGAPSNFMHLIFRSDAYSIELHEFDQEGAATGNNASSFNFRTAVGGGGGGGDGGGGGGE